MISLNAADPTGQPGQAGDPAQLEMLDVEFASNKNVTVISYGGGQESTWIVYKCAMDPEFRRKLAPGRLVVIGSDTGDEHDETYEHIEFMKEFCSLHGIEFHWITSDMGYHSESWSSLIGQYRRNNTVGSKAFSRTCTDNLKIGPLYRFLGAWIAQNYGLHYDRSKLGKTFFPFAAKMGKINMVIGFTSTEVARKIKTLATVDSTESSISKFRRATVEFSFPLIDLDMDRAATQIDTRAMGLPLCPPSNCKRCHFRGEEELLWLYRFERIAFDEWVQLEANKIAKFAPTTAAVGKKNLGVYGERMLPEMIARAIAKHGGMTDAELHGFRNSHGHAVSNGY